MPIDLPDRELLEAAPDAMVVVDEHGRIVLVNRQTETIFGYRREQLISESVEILVPLQAQARHPARRKSFANATQQRPMGEGLELSGRHQDGREIPVEISLSPIKTDGGSFVVAAIRDASYRREAAHQILESKQAAEEATRLKSRFLAAASHDLRQPLQSLGLYLAVIQRQLQTKDNVDDVSDVTSKMQSSVQVMGELLDTLLDISKFESGGVEPELADLPLQAIFEQLSVDNAPLAADKGLDLVVKSNHSIIRSDPGMLQRIVDNFVTNAIRYTETGSITISATVAGDFMRVEVQDTGIGIPQKELTSIFDEYVQIDNDVRDRRKGLGLGLAIAKHIANMLDHKIEVESIEGAGSTFSVLVPLVSAEITTPADNDEMGDARESEQPCVLFIEDDPTVAEATQMLLEMAGMKVHYAVDGEQALRLLDAAIQPDLIVSDYRLPGDNGVEVVNKVRQQLGAGIPAIMITGETSAKEIDQAGLDDSVILRKPINGDNLITLIHEMLA